MFAQYRPRSVIFLPFTTQVAGTAHAVNAMEGAAGEQGVRPVKKSLVLFPLLASLGVFAYLSSGAHGEAQTSRRTAPPASSVAVVDLSRVLKGYQRFQTLRDQMRSRVEDKETQLLTMINQAKQMRDIQKKLDPNGPDFRKNESELTQLVAKIETFRQQTRRALINEEATLYHDEYDRIRRAVAWVAERSGLSLVLRVSDEPVSPSNPEAVIKAVNRRVLYHDQSLDITDDVLHALNGSGTRSQTTKKAPPRPTRKK